MRLRGPFLRVIAATGALLALASPVSAQIHLSLFHPVSTNSDPNASATFAASVFQSRIGRLHGIGLHPLVSSVDGPATGVQVTGIFNRITGPVDGLLVTGGIASAGENLRGIQAAGLGHFGQGSVQGLQVAGVVNSMRGDLRGFQFAGFANMNGGQTRGLQLSSVANISEGPVRGLQIAGGMNFAQEDAAGLQVGLGNLTGGASHGAQIGFFNIAGDAQGLQLGALNSSNTNGGWPLGILNLSTQDGRIDITAFGSTLSAANVGVRTIVNGFQSTLAAGGPDLEGDVETAAFLSWMYGYRFALGETVSLGADIGFSHIMPEKSDDPTENDRLHFALLARLLPEVQLSPKVSIFAGPGLATIFDEYSQHAGSSTEALVTGGLAVRVK